jgi:hypothetical protein
MLIKVNEATIIESIRVVSNTLNYFNTLFVTKDFKIQTNNTLETFIKVLKTTDHKLSIASTTKHMAALFLNVSETGDITLVFHSFNESRKDAIGARSCRVDASSKSTIVHEIDTECLADQNGNDNTDNQEQIDLEVKALKTLHKGELINVQPYWINKGYTKTQLQSIVSAFNIFITKTSTKFPLYDVLNSFKAGKDCLPNSTIKSIYSIGTLFGEVNKNYSLTKFTTIYHNNLESDTLIITEGASTAATAHLMMPLTSVAAIGSITNAKNFGRELITFLKETKRYKKILCVFDNDIDTNVNAGLEGMKKHIFLPLLKLNQEDLKVALFTQYTTCSSKLPSTSFDLDDARKLTSIDVLKGLVSEIKWFSSTVEYKNDVRGNLTTKRNIAMVKSIIKESNIDDTYNDKSQLITNVLNKFTFLKNDVNRLRNIIVACLRLPLNALVGAFETPSNTIQLHALTYNEQGIPSMPEIVQFPKEKLSFYCAPMGAGKSVSVMTPWVLKGLLEGMQIIIITPSVALVDSTLIKYSHLGAVTYKNADSAANAPIIVTTIDSAHKFLINGHNKLVIVDEINEVLNHLMEPSRVLAKANTIAGFKRVIAAGGNIVNVSADVSHSIIEVMKILTGTSNAHLSIFASVQDTPQAKLQINVSNLLADGFLAIERALQAKEKLYIATDHKKMSEEIAAFCDAFGASTKVINSKTKDTSLLRPNDIDNKYDVIIGTPSISSGVSFSSQERVVVGFFNGVISATDMVQLLNRSRKRLKIEVIDLTTLTVERKNILANENASILKDYNSPLVSNDLLIELLTARKIFSLVKNDNIISNLQNIGYTNLTASSSVSRKECSLLDAINYAKEYKHNLEAQLLANKAKELALYVDLAASMSQEEVGKIISGEKRVDDPKIVAATLKSLDILDVYGIGALDDGLTKIAPITCLLNDESNMLANVYNTTNSKGIEHFDYLRIGSLLRSIDSTFNGSSSVDVHVIEDIISAEFSDQKTVNIFRAAVLGALGIKVDMLAASLKYENGKEKMVRRITDLIMSKLGCTVIRRRDEQTVVKNYAKTVAKINNFMYTMLKGKITQDQYLDSLPISDAVIPDGDVTNNAVEFDLAITSFYEKTTF